MRASFQLSKTDRFHVEATYDVDAGSFEMKLLGHLDEQVRLGAVFEYLSKAASGVKKVSIDSTGVTELNSSGVREWLFFMGRLRGTRLEVAFTRVGELFIDQAKHVPEMLGGGRFGIDEFEVPYFCARCDERTVRLLREKDLFRTGKSLKSPIADCVKCGEKLKFDDLEQGYFDFLIRRRP